MYIVCSFPVYLLSNIEVLYLSAKYFLKNIVLMLEKSFKNTLKNIK